MLQLQVVFQDHLPSQSRGHVEKNQVVRDEDPTGPTDRVEWADPWIPVVVALRGGRAPV